jgi:hypothetical protein
MNKPTIRRIRSTPRPSTPAVERARGRLILASILLDRTVCVCAPFPPPMPWHLDYEREVLP